MKHALQDWRRLWWPLAAFGMAMLISCLLYSVTASRRAEMEQLLQTRRLALAQAQERLLSSGSERENIVKFLPEYRRLMKRGFIGEEQRIDWIDDLRAIGLHYKLFPITYAIGTQQDYHPGFLPDTGHFRLHRSAMKFTLPLLHEQDLLTLLQALPAENNPPLMLRDCTIIRAAESREKLAPRLAADCELDWLTIAEPDKVSRNP